MTNQVGKIFLLVIIVMVSMERLSAYAKMPQAKIGENTIKLEVARTRQEIERGLMFRTSLAKDSGMVFLFRPNRAVRFWMFNTLIPLDMIFIKNNKIIKICHDVPPCKSTNPQDCPTYPSDTNENMIVSEVIEVNSGYCNKHKIKEGDSVVFEF